MSLPVESSTEALASALPGNVNESVIFECVIETENPIDAEFEEQNNNAKMAEEMYVLENAENQRKCGCFNAPTQHQHFGPCARSVVDTKTTSMMGLHTSQDPAFQKLAWDRTPKSVLVVKKTRDSKVVGPFLQLAQWLINERGMNVHIEASTLKEPLFSSSTSLPAFREKLKVFRVGKDDLQDKIDFVICLGGDGTLLHASSLFQRSVPPVMAFHLGSLGFMVPFNFENFRTQVNRVLKGNNVDLTLRSRLKGTLTREGETENASVGTREVETGHASVVDTEDYALTDDDLQPNSFVVLNDIVINRGSQAYLNTLDLYIDDQLVTVVQGDGLIISTPTGSTAYALAAGASMTHPSVPGILITPICPHSLSFRPVIVPAGVEIKIRVSADSRNGSASISFDGRNETELRHGDVLSVVTSVYSFPSISAGNWFSALSECLQWNLRKSKREPHADLSLTVLH